MGDHASDGGSPQDEGLAALLRSSILVARMEVEGRAATWRIYRHPHGTAGLVLALVVEYPPLGQPWLVAIWSTRPDRSLQRLRSEAWSQIGFAHAT